jgi:micrococcal nuclease
MIAPARRSRAPVGLAATLALLALLGMVAGCASSEEPAESGSGGNGSGNGNGNGEGTGPGPTAQTGTVVSITDGDTLRLTVDDTEVRVRLIGIDTPEVYPNPACFGAEAEAALADLAPSGSTVGIAYDRDPRDQYDRELLYLFTVDGTLINLELVAQGYAKAVLFEPNDRYWNELRDAEQSARDAERGLWAEY